MSACAVKVGVCQPFCTLKQVPGSFESGFFIMKTLKVFIPVIPKPQPRPRFTRAGHAYEPDEATAYKQQIALAVRQAMVDQGIPIAQKGTALVIAVRFYMPIPASWSHKKTRAAAEGIVVPTSRPDTDNLLKAVMDAINGVAWEDDSQVVMIYARKAYSMEPGVSVTMNEYQYADETKD